MRNVFKASLQGSQNFIIAESVEEILDLLRDDLHGLDVDMPLMFTFEKTEVRDWELEYLPEFEGW